MTLPWDDNGYRVLPAAAYMDHTEKMRELSNRFTPAVEALAREFGKLVERPRYDLAACSGPRTIQLLTGSALSSPSRPK